MEDGYGLFAEPILARFLAILTFKEHRSLKGLDFCDKIHAIFIFKT